MKNTILHCVSFVRQTSFKFLTRSITLLMLLALGFSSLWATDVTFTFNTDAGLSELGITKPSSGAGTNLSGTYSKGGVTMSFTSGSTATRIWNSSGTLTLRVYKNGSLTFAAPSGSNVTKVVVDGTSKWTGSDGSATIAASANMTISSITVTYSGSASKYTVTLSRNGVTEQVKDVTGEYTLPTAASEADACTDWKFKGWSTSTVASTTTAPSYVTKASATGTFYAVYGKTEGGGSVTYSFSITPSDFTTGGYAANDGEHTSTATATGESPQTVTWTSKNAYQNGGKIQIKKDSGSGIKNTTIANATVTLGSGSSNAVVSSNASGFSVLSNGSTAYVTSINVSYTEGSSTTTYTTSPNCVTKKVSSISVKTPPTTTTYTEGDSFDPAGMVIHVVYDDASTEDITSGFTVTPDPLTKTTTEVTISYGGKTTTQAVTVEEKVVEEYVLITSVDDLEAGVKYLIGNGTSDACLFVSTESNTNNRKTTSGTVTSNKVEKTEAMMALELGGSTGAWTFKTIDYAGTAGYLNATNTTGSNYLKVVSDLDNYSNFSISFSGNAAVITCTGKTSRNIIRANGDIISCYTSGQSSVYLYKENSTKPRVSVSPASLTAAKPNTGSDQVTATAKNFAGTVTYSWTTSDDNVATVSGSGATATVTYKNSGTCTITVTATDGTTTKTATVSVTVPQTYTVTYIEGGTPTAGPTLVQGETYTLPTNSTSCEGYTFLGWVTTPFTDGQSDKPASIQTPSEKTMGSANVTYYAVYKFTEDDGETAYAVTNDLSDLEQDGINVALCSKSENKFIAHDLSASAAPSPITATTSGLTLNDNVIWTLNYDPNGEEGYNWGFSYNSEYLSAESSSNNVPMELYDEEDYWKIVPNSSGGACKVIYNYVKGSVNDYIGMEYYSGVWKVYKTTGQSATDMWVLVEKSTATITYTNSPSCGPIIKAQGEPHITSAQSITIQAADSIQVKGTSLTGSTLSATSDNPHFTAELTNTSIVSGSIMAQLVIKYTPVAAKTSETATITIQDNTHSASQTITAHGYSLPNSFIITAKNSKNQWVALPSDMPSASTYLGIPAVVNDEAAPTSATKTADNTHYSLTTLRTTITSGETQSRYATSPWLVRLTTEDGKFLYGAKSNTNIYDGDASSTQSPYEWLLTTTNGIDYIIKNVSSNRTLAIHETDYIGQYNTGNNVFRIIPYVEECKHFAAPTNVVASVIKATTAKILFEPVRNATHYEYKVNGASVWTSVDASTLEHSGTRIILPVTGLTRGISNTVIIRGNDPTVDEADLCAPREETSISFTTALCEHVAELGASSPAGTTANVQWKSDYPGLSFRAVLYSDRAGTHILQDNSTTATNYTFSGLEESHTYYYRIYSSEDGVDDGCPSKVDSFSTKSPDVEIMTWHTDGIDIAVNMEGSPVVLIANEQTHGTEGGGQKADEVFFSKYFEASSNVKLLALFNGTDHKVGLCDYTIKLTQNGGNDKPVNTSGTHDWKFTKPVDQFTVESGPEDFIPDSLESGKELILISYSLNKGVINENDAKIIACAQDNPNSGFNSYYVVSDLKLDFNGNDAIGLWNTKTGTMIDLIGAGNSSGDDLTTFVTVDKLNDGSGSGKVKSINNQSRTDIAVGDIVWMDTPGGWYSGFGTDTAGNSNYALSTNRCLLIRKNTVRAGYNSTNQGPNNAVDLNKTDFVTLGDHGGVPGEWFGVQIPNINPETGDNDNGLGASCIGFNWVGSYDYSTYYKEFTTIGDSTLLDDVTLNPDGTYKIDIPGLDTLACTRLKLQMFSEKGATKPSVENIYKIPIMVSTSTTTNDELFTKLGEEVCKTCDLVVVENKQLTHTGAAGAIDVFGSVKLYEGSQLTVSAGQTLTATSLSLRSRQDEVASAYLPANNSVQAIDGEQPSVYFDKFISDDDWHWITVPFDVNIASVTFTDHTSCVYGIDWFLKYYDGEARADNPKQADGRNWKLVDASTTLHPGVGYIVAINDQANGKWKELRFPMAGYDETGNKDVAVRAYGAGDEYATVTPNHKGWNLVGNPYISYYKNFKQSAPLQVGKLNPIEDGSGGTTYENNGELYYVTIPNSAGRAGYTQALISATQLPPFTSYFVQIAGTTKNEENVVRFLASDRKTSASAPLRRNMAEEEEEIELPTFIGVNLSNSLGEMDNTGLCIMDAYTQSTYEVGADLGKWIGSKYSSYTQPILYSTAHSDKLAFNALSEEEAKQNMAVSLGCVLLQSGTYTFSLNRDYDLSRVESVFLYDALTNTNTDLTKSDYTFSGSAANKEINDRFYLSAVLREKVDVVTGLGMKTFGDDAIIKFITPDGQLHVARKGVIYDAQGRIEQVIR
ncbi:MAG: InlB B-repeat-containing protein [Bacteroidales bacterium]|nr:InlB B-repeat-containing protein [Candidatus Colicola equi]